MKKRLADAVPAECVHITYAVVLLTRSSDFGLALVISPREAAVSQSKWKVYHSKMHFTMF